MNSWRLDNRRQSNLHKLMTAVTNNNAINEIDES